ncbi:serine threonine protein kinase CMGC group, variant 2 [Entomophthora muscae]|uniref:Serine threonine protein kinase CMGC group, variant 2 n=1 Tax=Entomophthora muscae TaxID=34485 RepID=A0ACC2RFM5_9FUNG|nr:serine threonine protein kinase CMGC group, variant 2 [Entomophthora muscae]
MMSSSTGHKRALGLNKDYYEIVTNSNSGSANSIMNDANHGLNALARAAHHPLVGGMEPSNPASLDHIYNYNPPNQAILPPISQIEGCGYKRTRKEDSSSDFPSVPIGGLSHSSNSASHYDSQYSSSTNYLPSLRFDSSQNSHAPRIEYPNQLPSSSHASVYHSSHNSSFSKSGPSYSGYYGSEVVQRPPTPAYCYPQQQSYHAIAPTNYSSRQINGPSALYGQDQLQQLLLRVQEQQQHQRHPPLPPFHETRYNSAYQIQPPPPSPQAHIPAHAIHVSTPSIPAMAKPPPLEPLAPELEVPCDDKDGHFIVVPDQYITPRYRVVSLLGQGTFGRVAKCYDRLSRGYVAIKVVRAVPKYRDAARIEMRVLSTLKQHDPLNLNKCIHMIHDFEHRNHICMAFDLLGPSIFDFLKSNGFQPFPHAHVQHFARQILTSLAFIHNLGLVHTDLKPENILLVSSDHDLVPAKKKKEHKHTKILNSTEIRLIDFGSATFETEYHSSVVSTRHYRAPEIILGMGWSYPCDIWSVGCILVELYTGDALFQTHENLEHLAMMQAVLGPIPLPMISRANKAGQKLFSESGRLLYPTPETSKQSTKFVKSMKDISVSLIGLVSNSLENRHSSWYFY